MHLRIAKEFTFHSSHQLPNEEIYGKCSQLHGHTYRLIVEVEGEVNEKGWLINFKELKEIINDEVIDVLDHKHLNDIIGNITTAENIVIWIYEQIKDKIKEKGLEVKRIKLYETPTSYAVLYL